MGADDMYDVIKFKVGIPGKKVPALSLATVAPQAGMEVFLLPYSTRKDRSCTTGKVKAADAVEGSYLYYTLDMRLPDKMVSCPLMTAEGEVFGLAQKSSGQDTATVCYAVDARYAMAREIAALSYSDLALKGVGIKKALPDTERAGRRSSCIWFLPSCLPMNTWYCSAISLPNIRTVPMAICVVPRSNCSFRKMRGFVGKGRCRFG